MVAHISGAIPQIAHRRMRYGQRRLTCAESWTRNLRPGTRSVPFLRPMIPSSERGRGAVLSPDPGPLAFFGDVFFFEGFGGGVLPSRPLSPSGVVKKGPAPALPPLGFREEVRAWATVVDADRMPWSPLGDDRWQGNPSFWLASHGLKHRCCSARPRRYFWQRLMVYRGKTARWCFENLYI